MGKLIVILALSLLIAGCATDREDPDRGRSLALIIVEEWELQAEDSANTFSEIVERNAKSGGAKGKVGGLGAGCVAGGVAGVFLGPAGIELGCLVVGVTGAGVGYVVGFGIGAIVGTVESTLAAFQDEDTEADLGAPVAAIEEADPVAELAAALKQATRHSTDVSLTRLEGAQPVEDYGHLTGQGYPLVIVLTITDFYVSMEGAVCPNSRLHLAVKGEVIDTATNERQLVRDWTYTGDSVDSTKLAENESELLKSHIKMAWAEISSEIAADITP